jgi:hypothetical protein
LIYEAHHLLFHVGVELAAITSVSIYISHIDYLWHPPKNEFGNTAQPHVMVMPEVRGAVVGTITVWMSLGVVQTEPFGFGLGLGGDFDKNLRVALTEAFKKGICALNHGKGGFGAGPVGEVDKPSVSIAVKTQRDDFALSAAQAAKGTRGEDFGANLGAVDEFRSS